MINFDYSNISPVEFEELCAAILYKLKGVRFERFKMGKDGGIDLRHQYDDGKSFIVQCKRYSDFSNLYGVLSRTELAKVKELKPMRYGIMTSCELSPPNKAKIKQLFAPYVKNESDILGQTELNDLLGQKEYQPIVDRTMGLWWQSFDVLKRTLFNGIIGRSMYHVRAFQERNRFTFWTRDMEDAFARLERNQILIIEGNPGVGKTTAAQVMALKLVSKGYELIVIRDGITEAESVWDETKKQVFYYDDFLGSSYREAILDAQAAGICNFIARIRDSDNKALILTSRTIVLRRQTEQSVPLKNDRILNSRYCFRFNAMCELEKAYILYYRILASDIADDIKLGIISNKNYIQIIRHKNFTPRLIEGILQSRFFTGVVKPKDVLEIFLKMMSNPTDIWETVFDNQLSEIEVAIVLAIFLNGGLPEARVREVYLQLGGSERSYHASIKTMVNTAIDRRMSDAGRVDYVISNHAIDDYLIVNFGKCLHDACKVSLLVGEKRCFEKLFELAKQNKESQNNEVFKSEALRLLNELNNSGKRDVKLSWLVMSEMLEMFEAGVYDSLIPTIRTIGFEDVDDVAPYVCKVIDIVDRIDESGWVGKTGLNLDGWLVGSLMDATDNFKLCARLFQIARKNRIELDLENVGEVLTSRLAEYASYDIVSRIDAPVFEIESYSSWSIPDYEESRITEDLRGMLQEELDKFEIPADVVNIQEIIDSIDYRECFEPTKEELDEYREYEYDRETAMYYAASRAEMELTAAAIDSVFEDFRTL